jgi:hypothetical protein
MARNKKSVARPDDKHSTQESITSLVRLLLDVRGPMKSDLAAAIGIPPASLSHSMGPPGPRQRTWQAHDVRQLAIYYGISTEAFLGDPDARREVLDELREIAVKRIDDES